MSSIRSRRATQFVAAAMLLVDAALTCAIAGEPDAKPKATVRIGIQRQETAPILRAMKAAPELFETEQDGNTLLVIFREQVGTCSEADILTGTSPLAEQVRLPAVA